MNDVKKEEFIFLGLLIIPIIWLAILIAPYMDQGLIYAIPHFSEAFTKNTKVITILGSTIENMNKFHSTAIIQMPINGSKIYDAIVDIERLHKQNEYLLKYSNKFELN